MDIKTTQKYIIDSPKKLREVINALKVAKLSPMQSLERLEFMGKRAAKEIRKAIGTAIANAKQVSLDPSELVFKEITVNEGPVLKRFRAGSRGRAKPYKRRMSHIRVILTTRKNDVQVAKAETKKVNSKTKIVVADKGQDGNKTNRKEKKS